ncbi:NFACT family protein [Jeotgalicoccus sp. ATCC 8456]|uniref:Rqc2 family fibronectin-binding protein n=1 Tax=Jeotgalicoccus sp. ATCC 8456 TaxID=946435 RepID=UPI0018E62AB5|nr:NFACT RNA binding domain-containing protein [Jeotgalicoccus sp. ATCC 8456]QQD85771.1 NFACT family protein [Jeotgalicoccus sp. ATCC 8456]
MALDGNFTHALVDELQFLVSGKINKIHQMDQTTLLFKMRAAGKNHQLLISSHPMFSRFHITGEKYEFPFEPPMFTRVLRKHIEGGIITSVEHQGNDRIVHIHIRAINDIGDDIERILILEIMGRHSNIILTDQTYKIIESIKHLTPNNNARTIMPGFSYEKPPTGKKLNPRTSEINELPKFIDWNKGKVNKQILNQIEGFSPLFVKEVESKVTYFNKDNIVDAIKDALDDSQKVEPVFYDQDKPVFYFTRLHHLGNPTKTYNSLSELMDDFYHQRAQKSMIKQKASDYYQVIEREHDKTLRKIDKLKDDLKEAKEKDKYQKYGELITAYMHTIKPFQDSVKVLDYYTNEEIDIPLDQQRSPSENAQYFYNRYNKLKNREKIAEEQLRIAHIDVEYFNNLLHQMENITTEDEVEEVRQELVEERIIKAQKSKKKKKQKKIQLHEFVTSNGLPVFVGKNNKQNDYLTNRQAQNNHLWFHTKDIPGSHVVIAHNANDIEEADILEAAMLAAYYSKAGQSAGVPVDYTEIKHVKNIPGTKPGFVSYSEQTTVNVTPDSDKVKAMEK